MSEITINLTEKEAIALNELCSIQELSEEQDSFREDLKEKLGL